MNLETRARDAVATLGTATPVEVEDGLRSLHRTHKRRTLAKAAAGVAALAVGFGVLQVELDRDREAPPVSPPSKWVLVTASGIGGADNAAQPEGDEWATPLSDGGVNTYPNFRFADPATKRFLVQNQEATAWMVMRPGRREPLATIYADLGVILGPGPDEVTAGVDVGRVRVLGPDGQLRRVLGIGLDFPASWSPDGATLAQVLTDHTRREGSLSVVLRRPGSGETSTIYEYAEAAPPWYDAEEHRYGDMPGAFNDWGAPRAVDLRWAPDSGRLAFATMTTPDGTGNGRRVRWRLFVADTATGKVEPIADLGECSEPVDENGRHARVCDRPFSGSPSLAWTPDGERLTVLAEDTLTTYDLTGKVLDSEPTDITGPIVWTTAD